MNIVTIQKGNPYTASIRVTSGGTAYNLTGKTIFFAVKKVNDFTSNDDNALITESILPASHTDPVNGITVLSLDAIQTNIPAGEYKGDFKIYQLGIVQSNTQTFKVVVSDIVTKRIS